jgi:lactoylglutathione lyase
MNNPSNSNSNVKQAVPSFMVTSMNNSLDFYIKRLGFAITHKWEPNGKIEWCRLQVDEASLMLQEYKQRPAAEKLGEGVSIYYICEDALTIYNRIIASGLSVVEPFVGNNMWVVGIKDPDGYNIFFESPTEVPEETMYSDWQKQLKQGN